MCYIIKHYSLVAIYQFYSRILTLLCDALWYMGQQNIMQNWTNSIRENAIKTLYLYAQFDMCLKRHLKKEGELGDIHIRKSTIKFLPIRKFGYDIIHINLQSDERTLIYAREKNLMSMFLLQSKRFLSLQKNSKYR